MRITKEFLQKTARDTIAARTKTEKDMVAAYLVGSSLNDQPLLGGITDIDLIIVHAGQPPVKREILRVNDDIHLDIIHHPQNLYLQPRELRVNPWLGTSVQNHPLLLHDVRHWFEFTQASVGSQFYRSDYSFQRARTLLDESRNIWTDLRETKKTHAERVRLFLSALENVGNSVACLCGIPIPKRRFSQSLPSVFTELGQPGLLNGFMAIVGANDVSVNEISEMLSPWEMAFVAASKQEKHPMDIHSLRLDYYKKPFLSWIDADDKQALIMPLLRTWSKAITSMLSTTPEYDQWLKAMTLFHLGKEDFSERLDSLDAYLDNVEEFFEDWNTQH